MAPEVKSVSDILKMPLSIPNFQRPYRWKEKNVCDLLEDISFAIEKSKEHKNYKYRIGTLLLFCDINQSTNRLHEKAESITNVAVKKWFLNKCPQGQYNLGVKTPHIVLTI